MIDKHYNLSFGTNFIDTELYGYDLEISIFIYWFRDIWSTLQGDDLIRTLYETFKVDKCVILELHRYRRLFDLINRQLEHLVNYKGYIPNSNIYDTSAKPSPDTVNNNNDSNNSNDNSGTDQTSQNHHTTDDTFDQTINSSVNKGKQPYHSKSCFMDIINDIQKQTKYLSSVKHNHPDSHTEIRDNTHHMTYCDLNTCELQEPIPCRTRNVTMYQPNVISSNYNKSNNSSQNEDSVLVVNLSDRILTPPELAILNKGLKFCPTPGEPDISEHHNDLEKFHLRLKRYLHFYKAPADENGIIDITIIPPSNLDPNEPFKHQKFKNPSLWVPPPISNLEHFITKNHLDLSDTKLPKTKYNNISREEREAIKSLSKDSSIVIKQADKGGAVVIMNRTDYIKEGLRQLSDDKFYIETPSDLTSTHYNAIEKKAKDMLNNEEIDISCYDYLIKTPVRTAQFYMLPKIHKNKCTPPGRPIVSGNGCPTERISEFVDYFLQPGVKKISSYIQDTTDFLRMLQTIGTLPENTMLVTLDVSSLYTNIPNIEGIEACRTLLERERPSAKHPTNDSLIVLLTQVLTMNNFDFNEHHFLQVGGTAMGTRVAPCYANTFMGWFEDIHVYQYHTLPKLWKRYIDDIFVIWTHSTQQLDEFIDHLNQCMPSIKFETETSRDKVCFLDITVQLGPNGSITTDLYTKPTDSHNYLDYRSAHPKHCRTGIPFSQFLRLRRICSDTTTFVSRCREMSRHFISANYPPDIITSAFNRVFTMERQTLLTPKADVTQTDLPTDKSFLITTFHPYFRECDTIVTRNWDLLDRSSSTRPLMNLRVIKGNRRAKNLRDLLVRARLPRLHPPPTNHVNRLTTRRNDPNPVRDTNNRCTRHPCQYCRLLNRTGTITSNVTGKQYNTRSNVTCKSNNIIYCLSCRTCGKQYVGQTKRKLVERLREHFRNINNNSTNHIVGRHFNTRNHQGVASLEIHILCFIRASPHRPESRLVRLRSEVQWIHRLRSFVPKGLNLMDNKNYI